MTESKKTTWRLNAGAAALVSPENDQTTEHQRIGGGFGNGGQRIKSDIAVVGYSKGANFGGRSCAVIKLVEINDSTTSIGCQNGDTGSARETIVASIIVYLLKINVRVGIGNRKIGIACS